MNRNQPKGARTFSTSQYRSGWTHEGEIRQATPQGKVRLRWGNRPVAKNPDRNRNTQQDRNQAAAQKAQRP